VAAEIAGCRRKPGSVRWPMRAFAKPARSQASTRNGSPADHERADQPGRRARPAVLASFRAIGACLAKVGNALDRGLKKYVEDDATGNVFPRTWITGRRPCYEAGLASRPAHTQARAIEAHRDAAEPIRRNQTGSARGHTDESQVGCGESDSRASHCAAIDLQNDLPVCDCILASLLVSPAPRCACGHEERPAFYRQSAQPEGLRIQFSMPPHATVRTLFGYASPVSGHCTRRGRACVYGARAACLPRLQAGLKNLNPATRVACKDSRPMPNWRRSFSWRGERQCKNWNSPRSDLSTNHRGTGSPSASGTQLVQLVRPALWSWATMKRAVALRFAISRLLSPNPDEVSSKRGGRPAIVSPGKRAPTPPVLHAGRIFRPDLEATCKLREDDRPWCLTDRADEGNTLSPQIATVLRTRFRLGEDHPGPPQTKVLNGAANR